MFFFYYFYFVSGSGIIKFDVRCTFETGILEAVIIGFCGAAYVRY